MTTWIVTANATRARLLQVDDAAHRLTEVEALENPAPHATEKFARQVAGRLERAHGEHRFDRVHFVAVPKFLALLRQALGREVRQAVGDELPQELAWLDRRALE